MLGKRVSIIVILLMVAFSAGAADWRRFVANSDRNANPVIVGLLAESKAAAALEIVSALADRRDPYVADIIAALAAGFDSSSDFEREHLLRVLLASFFDASLAPGILEERASANKGALQELILGMGEIRDPQLKGELVRVIDLLAPEEFFPCITDQFDAAADQMRLNGGRLPPGEQALLLDLLSFAYRHPHAAFLQPCLEAARSSRDRTTVQSARAAAKRIVETLQ